MDYSGLKRVETILCASYNLLRRESQFYIPAHRFRKRAGKLRFSRICWFCINLNLH